MIKRSIALLILGLTILTGSIWLRGTLAETRSVVFNVFLEGATVASWISLWESFATFLVSWMPHRKSIRIYERLAVAEVIVSKVKNELSL